MFEPVKFQANAGIESQASVATAADSNDKNVGSDFFSERSFRQFGVFVAGAGLFAASMLITKRSIMRRYSREIPKFFQPSFSTINKVNGAMDALEALNLATVNVVSLALMTAGGMSWALDISSTDDMKRKFHVDSIEGKGLNEEYSDEAIEEWLASILMRKEFKSVRENHGITDDQLQAMVKNKKD
ncbi:hypothetical protein GcM1_250200 [Golovinomyces cichoracearum]|uniref:Altered inheritance of mitochondria protein 11 n=1 Tax=Golovinomyces cichoracearum TaxID=62708 RepID=A0A420IB87_9PEZI|nr:hypothetical protein GcM1_250200 [Golovinomyces cichoracearum]